MALASALAISGKFCWDCVGGEDGPRGSSYSMNQQPPPNNTAGCTRWFRCARAARAAYFLSSLFCPLHTMITVGVLA
jgi:hypothetical protein